MSTYQTNVGTVRCGRLAEGRKGKEAGSSEMRRLMRRLKNETRPAVRDRIASELDRVFRAAYRFRMKG